MHFLTQVRAIVMHMKDERNKQKKLCVWTRELQRVCASLFDYEFNHNSRQLCIITSCRQEYKKTHFISVIMSLIWCDRSEK